MKNRKIVLLAFLLVATMVVGVGYAAVTGSLSIAGTMKVSELNTNLRVVFTGTPEITDGEGYITAATATIAQGEYPTSATFQTDNFKKAGDKAEVKFTIENKSNGLDAIIADAEASITVKTVQGSTTLDASEYFKVTITHGAHQLKVGETTTVTVLIELIKTPTESIQIEYTINNNVTATHLPPVEAT